MWILAPTLIGAWLSSKFHSPALLVVCALLGVCISLWRMIRSLTKP